MPRVKTAKEELWPVYVVSDDGWLEADVSEEEIAYAKAALDDLRDASAMLRKAIEAEKSK